MNFFWNMLLIDVKSRLDDDPYDRVSRKLTVCILVSFGLLVGIKQFCGQPMDCWFPVSLTETQVAYARSVCWESRYFNQHVTNEQPIPGQEFSNKTNNIPETNVTKWVPYIFICQALLVFMPCILWRLATSLSSLGLSEILETASHCSEAHYPEVKEKALERIVRQLHRYLLQNRQSGCFDRLAAGERLFGCYLSIVFMFIKLLYFANAVTQAYLINLFYSGHYYCYSLMVIEAMILGKDWTLPGPFPAFAFCNMTARHQAVDVTYIIQCALPINVLNEKLFVFIWLWFVFLSLVTLFSFLVWSARFLCGPRAVNLVREYLHGSVPEESHQINTFFDKYMCFDVMLVVRLIGMNLDEGLAGEIMNRLWEDYKREERMSAGEEQRNLLEGARTTDLANRPTNRPPCVEQLELRQIAP